jgi:DNA-binding transcriptional regulator YiaG
MTNPLYPDCTTTKTGTLPFASGELDRSGLRLTRAEFGRFLGVSKQAVGEWVSAGKITLGADGRLDPRQAVSQLLRSTDPARLRAKVLAPLVRDVGIMQKRVAELEAALARATEDATFHEESAGELAAQLNALDQHLVDERAALVPLPTDKVIDGIAAWLKRVSEDGLTTAGWLSIFECVPGNGLDDLQRELDNLPLGALEENTEGEWGGVAEKLTAMEVDLEKMEEADDGC